MGGQGLSSGSWEVWWRQGDQSRIFKAFFHPLLSRSLPATFLSPTSHIHADWRQARASGSVRSSSLSLPRTQLSLLLLWFLKGWFCWQEPTYSASSLSKEEPENRIVESEETEMLSGFPSWVWLSHEGSSEVSFGLKQWRDGPAHFQWLVSETYHRYRRVLRPKCIAQYKLQVTVLSCVRLFMPGFSVRGVL